MTKLTRPIAFSKMHGLSNDFVIIDTLNGFPDLNNLNISALANRHTGIGFDQLLMIESSKDADFFVRIFNADGSEAEQCGNGLRCVARYVHEKSIHAADQLTIATKAGLFPINITDYDHIRVNMGIPKIVNKNESLQLDPYTHINVTHLSLGNPHTITKISPSQTDFFERFAAQISNRALDTSGTNVGCMIIIDEHHLKLRTLERGAGETNACGSNACAAVVAGVINNWIDHHAEVEFKTGSLYVDWKGEDTPIYMTGPASKVFDGQLWI